MLQFIARRIGVMLLTMFALSSVVFYLTNLEPNLIKLALSDGNMRMTDAEITQWLENNGHTRPFFVRYWDWLGGVLTGDWGYSSRFRMPVSELLGERLAATGALMFWVMVVMVPSALLIGVLAGMREGTRLDRSLSFVSISSTATPEYVSGIIFTVIFASTFKSLGETYAWFPEWFHLNGSAASATGRQGITFYNFTLPVMTMAIYGMGYIARMTRASMAEVMTAQYIRTARLKGVSFRTTVVRHALRNALIAPFTVIMLQFPWLLTGVVIVEAMFNYKGFGLALVEAAENNDIQLLMAASIVSVAVVLITQLISDIGYVYLNPRIRVK